MNTGPATGAAGTSSVSSSSTSIGSGSPSRPRTSVSCSGSSVITTSASRSSSAARTVSRSGSPGPAPTKDTHLVWRAVVLDAVMVTCFLAVRCGVQEFVGAVGHHLGGELAAEADRVVVRAGGGAADGQGAVQGGRDGADPELGTVLALDHLGQRADGGGAPGLELREHHPLALDGGPG